MRAIRVSVAVALLICACSPFSIRAQESASGTQLTLGYCLWKASSSKLYMSNLAPFPLIHKSYSDTYGPIFAKFVAAKYSVALPAQLEGIELRCTASSVDADDADEEYRLRHTSLEGQRLEIKRAGAAGPVEVVMVDWKP
jgi:hypothetical protein